ncbi:MAG: carboxylesterase family protein [Treponema sp.]|nr:carboxylesterase family protein [Treponema sp.]
MLRIVQTKFGKIEGLPAADPRITSFKGIPFAEQPVGNLRWHAPVPVSKKWDGVMQAYKFSPIPVQPTPYYDPNDLYCREWSVDKDIPMGEDCLTVNVWTPANAADEKLPVYFWIYGGGWQTGFTAEMEFDGERIARRGIVVVTVNYRLNMLGFLCHPEITAENPSAPANFGLLDQRCAMQWVKDNISAFGGDPDNITIGGQSAGGGSVLNQIAFGTQGIFKRAVVHSGMFYAPDNSFFKQKSLQEAEQCGVDFFNFIGAKNLAEARAIDLPTLRQRWSEYGGFQKSIATWTPLKDDIFVKGDFFALLDKNQIEPVPLIIGHTSDEFLMPKDPSNPQGEKFQPLAMSIQHYEELLEKNGKAASNWYYEFDVPIPGWDNAGTFHSCDLWFWFETLAKCWRPFKGMQYDVSRKMCNYLCNFVKTGNPNGKDCDDSPLPEWKPYTTGDKNKMLFNTDAQPVKL